MRVLVVRGALWTVGGQAGSQLTRLVRNVILTRLLYPEAFGLMSIIWAVMYGLEMISDTGIGPAIMRDKRGDDAAFLDTAWTVQIVRGAILWVLSCSVAVPLAWFYSEPALAKLLPLAGTTALIGGFTATAVHTARRRLDLGRLTLLEVSNEVVALLAVVLWAWLDRSVWALVGGAIISRLFFTALSHKCLPGIRNHLHWDASAVRALVGFGKWIYLSSIFQFVAVQSDRMMLARYVDMATLGVYAISTTLAEAIQGLILRINAGVLLPAYGNTARRDPQRLASVYYRARLGIDVFLVLPIAVLMVLGQRIVELLYDDRYHAAGWMFQVLCIRLIMMAALRSTEVCLVALGHPGYAFAQSAARACWIVVTIPLGWVTMGIQGIVWAVALSEVPVLIVLWIGLLERRLLSITLELRTPLFAAAGAGATYALLRALQ